MSELEVAEDIPLSEQVQYRVTRYYPTFTETRIVTTDYYKRLIAEALEQGRKSR